MPKKNKITDITSAAKARAKTLEGRKVPTAEKEKAFKVEDPLQTAAKERGLFRRIFEAIPDALEAAALSAQATRGAEGGQLAAGALGALKGTVAQAGKARRRKEKAEATSFEKILKKLEAEAAGTKAQAAKKQAEAAEQNALTRQFEAQTGSIDSSIKSLKVALEGEQIILTDQEKKFAGAREATADLLGALKGGVIIKHRPSSREARQALIKDGFTEMQLIGTSGRNVQSFFVKPPASGGQGNKDVIRVLMKQLEQGFELATQKGNEESRIRGEQLMELSIKKLIAIGIPAVPLTASPEGSGGTGVGTFLKNIFRPAATGTLGGDTQLQVGTPAPELEIPPERGSIEALRAKGASEANLRNLQLLQDAGLAVEAARFQVLLDDRLNRGIR